ncbi:hypothetical protein [Sulfurimonas sp.]
MFSFDLGKWIIKLIETSNSYFTLLELLNDKDAFNTYFNKKTVYDSTVQAHINITNSKAREMFKESTYNDVQHALDIYSNQLIVLLATYIETINSEFFQAVFEQNNRLIYDYVSQSDNNKGLINLNLIFDYKSKNEIIEQLIIKAKKNIVNGSLKKISERILKTTKYKINDKLISSLQIGIFDKRNAIVHESKSIIVKQEDIHLYFQLIDKYLLELGKACLKSNTNYYDPTNLLQQ